MKQSTRRKEACIRVATLLGIKTAQNIPTLIVRSGECVDFFVAQEPYDDSKNYCTQPKKHSESKQISSNKQDFPPGETSKTETNNRKN